MVSWTQRKTNEWILKTVNEEEQLLYSITKYTISYYGHIMRKTNCLEDIIQGCVSGYRSRGRQRRRWTENITDWTGLQVNTAVSVTEDRHRWNHDMLTANPLGGRRLTTTVLTRGLLAVANVVLPTLSCPLNTTIVSIECTYRQCFFLNLVVFEPHRRYKIPMTTHPAR